MSGSPVMLRHNKIELALHLLRAEPLDPSIPWKAVLIGKRPWGDKHFMITLGPLGTDPADRRQVADAVIDDLVDLYDSGMRAPLPLPCETAFAWHEGLAAGTSQAFRKAAAKWETDRVSPEAAEPAHELLLPHTPTLDALLDAGFGELAARLWEPILAVCEERNL